MSIRIAINGFGRIGRGVFRALFESGLNEEIALVAINDLADVDLNTHLAKFDSVHGKFPFELSLNGGCLSVENQKIVMLRESSLENLPWAELNVDVVLECTGFLPNRSWLLSTSTAELKRSLYRHLLLAPMLRLSVV